MKADLSYPRRKPCSPQAVGPSGYVRQLLGKERAGAHREGTLQRPAREMSSGRAGLTKDVNHTWPMAGDPEAIFRRLRAGLRFKAPERAPQVLVCIDL